MVKLALSSLADTRGLIRLPHGSQAEARAILGWENASRQFSFNTALIQWEGHWTWYQAMLSSHFDLLLVIEDAASELIGSVTFKSRDSRLAKIGVIVDPARRGIGWGRWAIEKGCRLAFELRPYETILAEVQPDNAASIRAFLAVGFKHVDSKPVQLSGNRMASVVTFELLRRVSPRTGGGE